jgi:hypothetical protein
MKTITEEHLKKLSHKMQVYFALFCANQVKENWTNIPECIEAIRVTELWLEGKASSKECKVAAAAAAAAAYAAAAAAAADAADAAAAYAAADAADAADAAADAADAADAAADAADAAAAYAYAAAYAAKGKVIKGQWDYYNELLNFDKNFEKVVLG